MQTQKELNIGDRIPIDKAEKSDTFFLVSIEGEKYLVDRTGKVVFKPMDELPSATDPQPEPKNGNDKSFDKVEPLQLRVKPGTPEFSKAVHEADLILDHFIYYINKFYRPIASRFEDLSEKNRIPYVKYMEKGKDPTYNTKAYLIREFFKRTTMQERGLEILEFLTAFFALKADGTCNKDMNLSVVEQKSLVVQYLEFVREVGETPIKKFIIEKTYLNFINLEYDLMKGQGGAGYYISSSLLKALKSQRDLLENKANCNSLEKTYSTIIKTRMGFFLDNMLAYLKALAILRLVSNSRKEDRGKTEDEREYFLYSIICYNPGWYEHKLESNRRLSAPQLCMQM